jgi:hypothetical protein
LICNQKKWGELRHEAHPTVLSAQLGDRHAGIGLLDEDDDLLGGESTLLHVRPLGLPDFTASRGTAQWGQVMMTIRAANQSAIILVERLGGNDNIL